MPMESYSRGMSAHRESGVHLGRCYIGGRSKPRPYEYKGNTEQFQISDLKFQKRQMQMQIPRYY
jgi:hypothetical protein